jgi:cytochrome c peroxidase
VLNNRKGWWKEPIPITATFIDPDNLIHGTVVSDGSDPTLFGTLNAPSAGYAAFSPPFHFDDEEGLYIGGQFWNGRASYLRDQAALPPLNPVEMAMPSEEAVIERLQERRRYVEAFIRVYGIDLTAVQTDGTDPSGVENSYRAMTLAIEAFERSQTFNRFTSKFDFVETGLTDYTAQEERGADLFDEVCAVCHEGTREDADGVLIQGLMTDFSYDNLGVPANVNIAGAPDLGLGGNPVVVDDGAFWSEMGKQKVMSLRNIAITPPYMHNGVFETLEQVVHFYNTRDVLGVCADNNDPTMGISCWPEPEIPDNVNRDELGDLGLSPEDEAAIVAYLKTFTDGYQIWGRDPVLKWWSRPAYHYLPEEIMPARPPVD